MASHGERWDAYFVKDENGDPTNVLSNNLGITSRLDLHRAERRITHDAAQELRSGHIAVNKTFNMTHLRSIHKVLFDRIYPWAGKVRTVAMTKGFTDFARPGPEIAHAMRQAEQIIATTPWATLEDKTFAQRMAQVFAWVNYAHPFREGNGRATRLFLEDVAQLAGRRLQFERIHPDAWNQRSEFTSPDRGSNLPIPEPMVEVFQHISSPPERQTSRAQQANQQPPLIDILRQRAQAIRTDTDRQPPTRHQDREHER